MSSSFTRGELEEIQAGVFAPDVATTTFDATGNNGKVSTAAALTTSLTGTNNDIVYTADTAGLAGNDITIEYNSTNLQPGQSAAVSHTSGTTIVVDLKTSAGVKATQTLTSSGVFQNTETVTIGTTVYTFMTALSTGPAVAYEVLIGASAAASLDNLKSAVNLTAGIGTTYSTGTAIHPTVTATTNTDTTQLFEAKTLGAAANAIATTETTANNAFGAATMTGGEDINQVLSTADEVKTAVEADTAAAALVGVADAGGNDGSGVVTVMAATNLTGGSDGTVNLFTIEQDGLIAILGDCTTDLTGATATLEVGIAGNTAALIPQTVATTLDDGERIDRSGVIASTVAPNVTPFFPVRAGDVVILTVGTASIDTGVVEWQAYFKGFDFAASGSGVSSSQIQGAAADNDAATGNPVHVAGRYESGTDTYADGDVGSLHIDVNGNLKAVEQYAPVYEDNTNGKAVVEHRYTSSGVLAADTLVKTGAGLLHTVVISCNDAAPTAGSLIIYDNTAESGTQIFNHTFTTTPFTPISLLFDVSFSTGLYVGLSTTADVNVTVSYR